MADARIRFVEFERGEIDMETGEFPMTLATDGEASDGDILSIEGAQFTARAPLQISHINDPRDTLGTVSGFRRDLQSNPKKLKARGQIELGGDGPAAEIRRDLAYMVQQGHVTGISVRWEPVEWQRRSELPKESPHYVDPESEKDPRKRYGLYFKKWRVLEGSIVAIQADKAAMIGRAEATTGHVSAFWRAMVDDAVEREQLERRPEDRTTDTESAEPTEPAVELDDAAKRAIAAARLRETAAELGLSLDDLSAELDAQRAPVPPTVEELSALLQSQQDELAAMRRQLASLEVSRVSSAPAPLHNVAEIVSNLESRLEGRSRSVLLAARTLIDRKVGKLRSSREQAHAEVDALIRQASGEEIAFPEMVSRLESVLEAARAKGASARLRGEVT